MSLQYSLQGFPNSTKHIRNASPFLFLTGNIFKNGIGITAAMEIRTVIIFHQLSSISPSDEYYYGIQWNTSHSLLTLLIYSAKLFIVTVMEKCAHFSEFSEKLKTVGAAEYKECGSTFEQESSGVVLVNSLDFHRRSREVHVPRISFHFALPYRRLLIFHNDRT